jgi:hypothetical protein
MSSPSHGFVVFANHVNDPIVDSLDAGYRGLALDLCNCNGKMEFCHGGSQIGCAVGRRDPVDTFEQINNWVDDNPNNVVMIWLQINEAAGGPISLTDVDELVNSVPVASSGRSFASRMYRRDRYDDSPWPTLSEMIDIQQPILFFYMSGPNGSQEPPPGIHHFYEYGMSNHWSYASVSELRDTMMNGCPVPFGSSNRNDFLMFNNFVTAKFFGYQVKPEKSAAEEINTGTFLEPLLDVCEAQMRQKVNIVSVDFWSSGDLTAFIDDQNSQLAAQKISSDPQTAQEMDTTPQTVFNSPRKKPSTVDRLKSMEFGG